MRHAVFAAALIPVLVVAVRPSPSAASDSTPVLRDSCSTIVDSALYVARERIAGSDAARAASMRKYFFAHEVTKRASISRRGATPARADTSAALVQFVVGPSGSVDTASVRVLAAGRSGLRPADAAERVGRWTFQPAAVRSCPVAQLVQTRLP